MVDMLLENFISLMHSKSSNQPILSEKKISKKPYSTKLIIVTLSASRKDYHVERKGKPAGFYAAYLHLSFQ